MPLRARGRDEITVQLADSDDDVRIERGYLVDFTQPHRFGTKITTGRVTGIHKEPFKFKEGKHKPKTPQHALVAEPRFVIEFTTSGHNGPPHSVEGVFKLARIVRVHVPEQA